MKPKISASSQRTPLFCSHRIRKASSAVSITPNDQRDAEQQFQRDGRADQFRQVGGADRDLGKKPERVGDRLAGSVRGRVGPGRDPWRCRSGRRGPAAGSPSARKQRNGTAACSRRPNRRRARSPSCRVHVADRDQIARTHEGEELAQEPPAFGTATLRCTLGQAVVGRPARMLQRRQRPEAKSCIGSKT